MAPHTILFIAANPVGTDTRALDKQARVIQDELERAGRRNCFKFETRWDAQPLDLLREMVKLKPTVVHFCGGRVTGGGASAAAAGVYFRAADGHAQLVTAKALAKAFQSAGSVKLVVLDACYSEGHAVAVAAHIDCVVGMAGETVDGAATSFAIGLYGGLGEGESVATAFQQGCAAIGLAGAGDPDQPLLRVRPGVDATGLVLTQQAESERWWPEEPSLVRICLSSERVEQRIRAIIQAALAPHRIPLAGIVCTTCYVGCTGAHFECEASPARVASQSWEPGPEQTTSWLENVEITPIRTRGDTLQWRAALRTAITDSRCFEGNLIFHADYEATTSGEVMIACRASPMDRRFFNSDRRALGGLASVALFAKLFASGVTLPAFSTVELRERLDGHSG